MADAEFAKVCKQEAVPELATLLPRVAATGALASPLVIDVTGSKCLRRLTDADVEVLVRAVQKSGLPVEGIALRNHDITDEGVATLCKLLGDAKSTLASLELPGNAIGCKGCEHLAGALASNKTLKRLDLSWNPVGMRGGFRLAEMLVSNVALEVLRLGNVDFTTDTLIALLSLLRTNEVIVEFDCSNPRLFSRQEDTTKHIARVLELNRTLRTLNLAKCLVGDDGAAVLAEALVGNPSLRSLKLACNQIGANGAEAFARLLASGGCRTLVELELSSNAVGDDGAIAFADAIAAQPGCVRKLDLRMNGVGDDGLVRLARAVGTSEITELLLWGNDFGRAAAAEFDALLNGPFLYNSVKTDLATYTVDGVIYISHAP